MTIKTGSTRTGRLADRGRTMHVPVADDRGRGQGTGEIALLRAIPRTPR